MAVIESMKHNLSAKRQESDSYSSQALLAYAIVMLQVFNGAWAVLLPHASPMLIAWLTTSGSAVLGMLIVKQRRNQENL